MDWLWYTRMPYTEEPANFWPVHSSIISRAAVQTAADKFQPPPSNLDSSVSKIVVVGGGSAGWLTAGLLASQLSGDKDAPIEVPLIESPDVSTIGVGEGTWPTMRSTLKMIGIP